MFSKIQMMAKNYKISSTLTLLLYCLVPMATGCGRIKEKTMVSPGDEIYVSLLLQPNTESEDLSKADDSAYIHQPNTESEDASKNTESVYIPPKPLHFMKNKRYRRYIDPVSDISPEAMDQPYLKIFQKTDSNSDGYITVDEYLENNPNMTNDDTRIVMEVYDKNRDSRVSQAEFLREGKPAFFDNFEESRTEACDVMALHQCGMDFINIVQLARDDNEAVCIGLQAAGS
uniref:Uncharacterized protein LOC100369605 n=1 Tax=Saccoglossus kowalevskii TaxID=10224 RepID=A0ABM0M2C5_SACKO|nr:PREDICTED: uncharacterized protein LOC100369605 [Saccoglossus kowalevskii]